MQDTGNKQRAEVAIAFPFAQPPELQAGHRAPGGDIGLIGEIEPGAAQGIQRGLRLAEIARLTTQFVCLNHDIGVKPADIGLAAPLRTARPRNDGKIADIKLDRPDILEMMRCSNAEFDRVKEQLAAGRITRLRQARQVHQRMIEIPRIRGIGVFILTDIWQVAPQDA